MIGRSLSWRAIANGVTLVDGKPLKEPYLHGAVFYKDYSLSMNPVKVPAQTYFVMGEQSR